MSMDHEQIEQDSIIERYVLERLPADEETSFEEHLLECSQCLERVQWAQDFAGAFQSLAAQEGAAAVTATRLGLLAWLARRSRRQQLGLVLVVLLVLVAAPLLLVLESRALRSQLERARIAANQAEQELQAAAAALQRAATAEQEQQRLAVELDRERATSERLGRELTRLADPQINTPLFSLGMLRGSSIDSSNRISVSSEPQWIVLSLELPPLAYSSYRATLLAADGSTVWQGSGLEPGAQDTLLIGLSSGFLAPGRYRFQLQGATADGRYEPVGEIPMHVVAAP